jgi:hypothetical protein
MLADMSKRETDVTTRTVEMTRREQIVSNFKASAANGDVALFAAAFAGLNWVGAFREAFARLVTAQTVDPSIPPIFLENWRRMKGESRARMQAGVIHSVPDWHLERDLCDQPLLMADALKLLLPPFKPRQHPMVLYRGQRLADHEAGTHGIWWTACPIFAEFFGVMPTRTRRMTGVVVMTADPSDAILGEIDGEYLVDPRRLDSVQIVSVLPSWQSYDMNDPNQSFFLKGVPDGFDGELLLEWLDLGRPVNGVETVRNARANFIRGMIVNRKAVSF